MADGRISSRKARSCIAVDSIVRLHGDGPVVIEGAVLIPEYVHNVSATLPCGPTAGSTVTVVMSVSEYNGVCTLTIPTYEFVKLAGQSLVKVFATSEPLPRPSDNFWFGDGYELSPFGVLSISKVFEADITFVAPATAKYKTGPGVPN